jgi:hypothetical protein
MLIDASAYFTSKIIRSARLVSSSHRVLPNLSVLIPERAGNPGINADPSLSRSKTFSD